MKNNSIKTIKLDKLFLDLKNPRHIPYNSETDVIRYLCEHENILNLAKDIVLHGLNPLENFSAIKDEKTNTYIMAEGNRRLCAIKLLNDPLLAPKGLQKKFREISSNWKPINAIDIIVFNNKEDVDLWLARIHAGQQNGIGRRQWSTEQKTRHFGDSKNILAQMLLDLAEEQGLMTFDSRKRKLSIVQRFSTNRDFKDFLNINSDNINNINIDRFKIFIKDLIDENIDTRTHPTSESVTTYVQSKLETNISSKPSNKPNSSEQNSSTAIENSGMSNNDLVSNSGHKEEDGLRETNNVNNKPKSPTKLRNSKELKIALESLNNYKLQKLYYSLHEITVRNHAPLITIGIWSFLETLTFLHGRQNGEFFAYCNNKFQELGFRTKEDKAIKEAIQRFHENGNTTKHHPTAATFNVEQIINDFEVILPFLISMAKSVKKA